MEELQNDGNRINLKRKPYVDVCEGNGSVYIYEW